MLVLSSLGLACLLVACVCILANTAQNPAMAINPDGLTPAGTNTDLVLRANDIEITFARRLAGAVWTMRWKGHDFVGTTEGNGGSQQSAVGYDVLRGHSNEEENPTEAGNVKDRAGSSASKWASAAKSGTEAYTQTHMAYFIPPGQFPPASSQGFRARGDALLSDTWMAKRVTIGWRYPNVVNYQLAFHANKSHWFAQIEALTGYMPSDFKSFYVVKNGGAQPVAGPVYRTSPPQRPYPIVVAKSNEVALGVYAHTAPPNGRFGNDTSPWYSMDTVTHGGHEPRTLRPVRFTKWNVVWQAGSQDPKGKPIPRSFMFGIALVFGSVDVCASTIAKLMN